MRSQHIILNILVETMSSYTHTEEYTMFKKLIAWLQQPSYQNELDAFIASKHPTTTVEVEYWIRQYDQRKEWAL